ncbi:MAG: glycosyltransferase family 4 protein [Ruminococcus sp.]|nr:glycosyltransferase family 4 protein [Ruminococcus sp.]
MIYITTKEASYMKVCLLNDSFPPIIDGVATAVTNYANIMTASGRARVLVGTPRYPNADYSGYPYTVVPYQSFDLPDIADGYRAGNPLSVKSVSEMTKFDPDIIHVHCPAVSAVMGRILRNETNAPIVFTYHTKYDIDIARAIKSEHIQKEAVKVMITNISACDEVWTVSHGAGDSLHALGYEGDIRVVSNGVDFAKGQAEASLVAETVREFDLPENIPMFLFVGRIIKYKGLPLILDAMRRLSEQKIDYRMVFVGSGVDAPELQQTVREYGISLDVRNEDGNLTSEPGTQKTGKVIFTGAVYDRNILRAWNTRADAFLFPSTYDTNGIVVREAAACGLASVLIQGSCAAEGITHGRNGWLVEENGESISALLAEISKNFDHMHQVGQQAMNEIYISWEESVMNALDRYQTVLEMKHAGTLKPRRNGKSDKFLHVTADMMEFFYHMFHTPKALYQDIQESVRENLYGMQENVAESEKLLHELYENVRVKRMELKEGLKEEWHKRNGSKN